jgi:hypothetical protein
MRNVEQRPLTAEIEQRPLTAENVIAFVREFEHVSFVDLQNHFENATGAYELALDGRNIVLWDGLSEALVAVLRSDAVREALDVAPCSPWVYLLDGATLRLPLAKRAGPYKKPHWAPVVFNPRRRPRAKPS